jgi:two-component system sensor histidine kinase DesK
VRDVRDAVSDSLSPSLEAELAAAEVALRTAGIDLSIERNNAQIDPAHESTLAWAVREAVTNVVKHSRARTCRIALQACDGVSSLEVDDDGRGPANGRAGAGLDGLADRVRAVGGTLEVGPAEGRGFKLQVRLAGYAPAYVHAERTR